MPTALHSGPDDLPGCALRRPWWDRLKGARHLVMATGQGEAGGVPRGLRVLGTLACTPYVAAEDQLKRTAVRNVVM